MSDEIERILRRPGSEWSEEERGLVFGWLAVTEGPKMLRLAASRIRRCGGQWDDALNITQQTFLELYRSSRTYDPLKSRHAASQAAPQEWGKTAFRTWAFTALWRKSGAYCLQRSRNREELTPAPPLLAAAAPATLPSHYEALLGFLPKREQRAVELIAKAGYSPAEAASLEGYRPGAMRVRYFTAVHRMELIEEWLGSLSVRRSESLIRRCVGERLPLGEAARRSGVTIVEARIAVAADCAVLRTLRFSRGRLLHQEVDDWMRAVPGI